MIVHIVNWDIAPEVSPEDKDAVKALVKEKLEALVGLVPGLISARVETNPLSSSNVDIALISEVEDVAALKAYQEHPKHKEAGTYIKANLCNRRCLDYEVK